MENRCFVKMDGGLQHLSLCILRLLVNLSFEMLLQLARRGELLSACGTETQPPLHATCQSVRLAGAMTEQIGLTLSLKPTDAAPVGLFLG